MSRRREVAEGFYIDDHALLFGMLARAADELYGAEGDEASVYAIRLYAEERGRRMRKRAEKDHMPLTLETYRMYTEWEDMQRRMQVETVSLSPNYRMNGTYCVWNDTWKRHGMDKYGQIYCANVDQTMVDAFNPENELIIHSTLWQEGAGCDFEWVGLNYPAEEDFKEAFRKKQELRDRAVKDFLYHCGHMLSAMKRGYVIKLGTAAGEAVAERAMENYQALFGEVKGNAVLEESKLDFQAI